MLIYKQKSLKIGKISFLKMILTSNLFYMHLNTMLMVGIISIYNPFKIMIRNYLIQLSIFQYSLKQSFISKVVIKLRKLTPMLLRYVARIICDLWKTILTLKYKHIWRTKRSEQNVY